MKIKATFICAELILVCFLSGCSGVAGLDEQLIVYGIGVDKNNGDYELTLQALNTQNTSDSDTKNSKKNFTNVSAKAVTLIDSVNQLENQVGKKILYSHTIVLIIGEDTAQNGIGEIINFFATNHKLRPTVEVLIANGSAKEIFSNEDDEKTLKAEDILATTRIGKENDDAINSNIRYLLSDLNNDFKAAKVWYAEYDKGKLSCAKIALFKSGKLTDILDKNIAKGVMLVLGKAKNISDNFQINDAKLSYEISKANSYINVAFTDNKPIFNIKLDVNLELYGADILDATPAIKTAVENRLNSLASDAINFCIKTQSCDVFNFYRYIMNSDTNFFKSNLNRIENIIQNLEFNVKTNAKIKYMGTNQKISSLVY